MYVNCYFMGITQRTAGLLSYGRRAILARMNLRFDCTLEVNHGGVGWRRFAPDPTYARMNSKTLVVNSSPLEAPPTRKRLPHLNVNRVFQTLYKRFRPCDRNCRICLVPNNQWARPVRIPSICYSMYKA